jgi:Single-strand binding protein family
MPLLSPSLSPCATVAPRNIRRYNCSGGSFTFCIDSLTSRQFRYRRSGISGIHCAFCGNLGEDGTLRYTKTGKAWLSFPVAVDNQVTEGDNTTTWVRASVFGEQAETLRSALTKGGESISKDGLPSIQRVASWREKTQCSAKSACSSMFLNRWPSRCVESPPLPPWQRHPKASK